ncbi:SDR family oxidoreductase [Nocardioides sp. LMS-CY]|uniref:NAD(P)-dependent dehydrogenase (Short-subunit alcohol dehydrogenase family) n=1 Tax=Nocardioides soli TaxID=1036020 RepID=A0A7W4VZV1_9ACTN|nr:MULTISPECIES: SDR family NAD(P)-dependent oxidoreductase [Nocardioides]MBB3044857.1 NAD(P)-dependent dehydrogenase (short-subunit alcohol dehydrogenase family) [Nocardioides soli]QWF24349.1 SDR family oxidoreductase [Nocardioides sp. LMS-CY]
MPVAVITGASQGLGLALAHGLAGAGWSVVADARDADRLQSAVAGLPGGPHLTVAGDVTDSWHRGALAASAADLGGADLLVNNASTLGASPLPRLADLDPSTYARILEVNVVAPVALAGLLLPQLRGRRGRILSITSDASVEAYETWGGYGSAKAALDHAMRVLAAEEPLVRVYAADPGDLRTAMHQAAFPGEDISDRPEPVSAVPHLMALVEGELPSGRYRAADLAPVTGVRG